MFLLGSVLAIICGAWWHFGRLEHSANVKKKVGVALLNALGWGLMLVGLVRWWF